MISVNKISNFCHIKINLTYLKIFSLTALHWQFNVRFVPFFFLTLPNTVYGVFMQTFIAKFCQCLSFVVATHQLCTARPQCALFTMPKDVKDQPWHISVVSESEKQKKNKRFSPLLSHPVMPLGPFNLLA